MSRVLELLDRRRRAICRLSVLLLALMVAGVYVLVYMTGGIKFVYSHSMYIPILLSGLVFGFKGGILVGLLGGFVLGPFMPIDVGTGEMQQTANWLYRTGFFVLIGFLSGVASDAARSYIERIKWVSRHDLGTRLPNRNALLDSLQPFAKGRGKRGQPVLVVIIIENELELRSSFGETVISEIIQQAPQRVEGALPCGASTYRLGSSQIAVLIDQCGEDAEALVGKLVDAFQMPFLFDGIQIHADIRMGYVFDQPMWAPESSVQMAEVALAVALEKAQDKVAYSPALVSAKQENLAILGELKEAIGQGQLMLHYQPKIDLGSGKVLGVEALMRWMHPEKGIILPGNFIPRAEHSTLINLIGELALDKAMAQAVQWQESSIEVSVAVNISPRNLLQPGFADLILRLLGHHRLKGDVIELEVTETALMTDMEHTIHELARLAGSRLIISIDDFGTGYSSLQYLHLLPISLIKIDQSFVRRLPHDMGAVHIVEAAVSLAHKMGMKVIAEGVETAEAYDFLRNAGCDMAQGYLIARPMQADDFVKWLSRNGGYHQRLQ